MTIVKCCYRVVESGPTLPPTPGNRWSIFLSLRISNLDLGKVHHSVTGGISPGLINAELQQKADEMLKDIDLTTRRKVKEMFERDFTLFEYKWDIATNKIF